MFDKVVFFSFSACLPKWTSKDPGQHATDALSGAGALCDEVRRYHAVSDLPTLTITPRTSESHHSRGQSKCSALTLISALHPCESCYPVQVVHTWFFIFFTGHRTRQRRCQGQTEINGTKTSGCAPTAVSSHHTGPPGQLDHRPWSDRGNLRHV